MNKKRRRQLKQLRRELQARRSAAGGLSLWQLRWHPVAGAPMSARRSPAPARPWRREPAAPSARERVRRRVGERIVLFIAWTLTWAFLLMVGLVIPAMFVGEWVAHSGMVPMDRASAGIQRTMVWVPGTAALLASLCVLGAARVMRPLATALMFGFGYGLFLPAICAGIVIFLVEMALMPFGAEANGFQGAIYVTSTVGWLCYAVYLFFSSGAWDWDGGSDGYHSGSSRHATAGFALAELLHLVGGSGDSDSGDGDSDSGGGDSD